MVHRAAPPRHQRVAVLATVFALHAALIALFLFQRPKMTSPEVKRSTVAMVAIDAEQPAAAKPPPPTLPAKLADTFKPLVEFSIPADTESDAPAGATGVCSMSGVVLDALLLDPAAIDAIRRAPPETRSVAEAVVIWNEGWNPAAIDLAAPLGIVRATIERSLSGISDGCLDEPVAGPDLLPIPDGTGTGTIFLVFGSGSWTWRALLTPPLLSTVEGGAPVARTPAGAL